MDLGRLLLVAPAMPSEREEDWAVDDMGLESVDEDYRRDVEEALVELGWPTVWLDGLQDMLDFREKIRPGDFVLQLGWESGGRNRKALVPALCEIMGVPFWGADLHFHSLAKDKTLVKAIAREAGFLVPQELTVFREHHLPPEAPMPMPVIVKPAYEGGSIGISQESVCHDWASAAAQARSCLERYRQPVMVEQFIAGAELTVVAVGNGSLRRWGVVETVFSDGTSLGARALTREIKHGDQSRLHSKILRRERFPEVPGQLEALSRRLGFCDVYRVDARLDEAGNLFFLEVNPDVHLGKDGSVFDLYQEESWTFAEYFRDIVATGASRWGIKVPE